MKRFEKKYIERRCFIVGNGPSLNKTPLDELEFEYTFGMNQINLIYDQVCWKPTFYVAVTKGYWVSETWRKNIEINVLGYGLCSFIARSFPIRGNNVFPMDVRSRMWDDENGWIRFWSDHPDYRVCHYATTIYDTLQLAAWMGFSPIYLVGCDLGYAADGEGESIGHFTESYWGDRGRTQPFTPKLAAEINLLTERSHRIARHFLGQRGIKIYNATVGGELEVYPRIAIHEALK